MPPPSPGRAEVPVAELKQGEADGAGGVGAQDARAEAAHERARRSEAQDFVSGESALGTDDEGGALDGTIRKKSGHGNDCFRAGRKLSRMPS